MTVGGGSPIWVTVGTVPRRILQKNPRRSSFTLIAPTTNVGIVYFAYDQPAVSATADPRGIPLAAGAQATETQPEVFEGEVYAVATLAADQLIVVETMRSE